MPPHPPQKSSLAPGTDRHDRPPMVFLLLAILCSASIALLFKHSETRGLNRYALTSANYVVATAASLVLILRASGANADWPLFQHMVWGLGSGALAGVLFFVSFLLYQESVKEHGAGLAGSFMKLGIFVPVGLSLLWFGESSQWSDRIAIALAAVAILVTNAPTGRGWRKGLRPRLIALLFAGGCAEFMNGVFEHFGRVDHAPFFLFGAFGTALVLSVVKTARAGGRIQARAVGLGLLVGLPNLGSSAFLIAALATVPAGAAFAGFGAGTILVIAGGAWLVFGEKPDRKSAAAMVLTAAALVVMQMPF